MRYVLTFAFILGLSTFVPAQADEVGGGYVCPDCMGGFGFMTAPLVTEDEDDSSSAKTTQPADINEVSLWSEFTKLFSVE